MAGLERRLSFVNMSHLPTGLVLGVDNLQFAPESRIPYQVQPSRVWLCVVRS